MAGSDKATVAGTSGRAVIESGQNGLSRRQLLKRGAALGASMSVMSGLLAAGAGAAPRPGGPSKAAFADAKKLKLYNDKAPWEAYFKKMASLSGPAIGVTFDPVEYSDTTTYQQTIQSSLPTNEVPDLFTWWSGYRMEDMVKSNNLLDVSDLWKEATTAGNLPESLASAFTFDGKQFAMPLHVSYWPVFYNKQVFSKNEIEVPATWSDLMAAAEKLKSANVTPFFATTDGRWPAFIWFEELLIRTDPQFYDDLCNGKKSYEDPIVTGVFETWKEMFDKKYFTPLDTPMDSNAADMFAKGDVAMMPVGTWFNGTFVTAKMKPGEDYDVFILPNVKPDLQEKVIIFETGPLCIPAKAKDAASSKKLAGWWVTPDAETAWAKELQDVPANPKATIEMPMLATLSKTISDQKYHLIQRYWEASPPQIVEAAVDELGRFMLNPGQYKDVQKNIQSIAQKECDKRAKA